jgi:hypothetical protein
MENTNLWVISACNLERVQCFGRIPPPSSSSQLILLPTSAGLLRGLLLYSKNGKDMFLRSSRVSLSSAQLAFCFCRSVSVFSLRPLTWRIQVPPKRLAPLNYTVSQPSRIQVDACFCKFMARITVRLLRWRTEGSPKRRSLCELHSVTT